jgi:hypothetical protein
MLISMLLSKIITDVLETPVSDVTWTPLVSTLMEVINADVTKDTKEMEEIALTLMNVETEQAHAVNLQLVITPLDHSDVNVTQDTSEMENVVLTSVTLLNAEKIQHVSTLQTEMEQTRMERFVDVTEDFTSTMVLVEYQEMHSWLR